MTSDDKPLKVDGHDEAIIGQDYKQLRMVYSIERIIETLMIRDEMSMEEAIEYFDHNIGCAYVGEMTPIYVWTEGIDE